MLGPKVSTVLLWTTYIVALANGQPNPNPDLPPANARRNTTRILRSPNYRDVFFAPVHDNDGLRFAYATGDEPSVGLRLFDARQAAERQGRFVVDHILELNLVQSYINDQAARPERQNEDRDFATKFNAVIENRDSLRNDNERNLQRNVIIALNRIENLAGIAGPDALDDGDSESAARVVNTLKYHALRRNIRNSGASRLMIRRTLAYLREDEIQRRYRNTAELINNLIGHYPPQETQSFVHFARAEFRAALSKLESWEAEQGRQRFRIARSLEERATPQNVDWALNSNVPRNWSRAFMNDGNGVYTALGDSFSAGLGAGRELPNTQSQEGTTNNCRRYDQAYPLISNGILQPSRFDNYACSSDTTREVLNQQLPKVDRFSSLVTITIGGNDVGFGDVALACVYNVPTLPRCLRNGRPTMISLINCCRGQLADTNNKINAIRPTLVNLYRNIRQRVPRANVVVLGYPYFYNINSGVGLDCLSSADLRTSIFAMTRELNNQIRLAANDAGFRFADPNPYFEGHRFCDRDPWFISNGNRAKVKRELLSHPHWKQPGQITGDVVNDEIVPAINNLNITGDGLQFSDLEERQLSNIRSDSTTWFHPSRRGQRAYADCALNAISILDASGGPTNLDGPDADEDD